MPATPPANMRSVGLPIGGLVPQPLNALVAWHPNVSFELPLLIVLFFHGQEADPQNKAWSKHLLPAQIKEAKKNAVLIAPTMTMDAGNNVVVDYLSTHDQITQLVRHGLAAIAQSLGIPNDPPAIEAVMSDASLILVGYSNGYRAWTRCASTLQTKPPSTEHPPPPAIGHCLFDSLYWDTLVMSGVRFAPAGSERFSKDALDLLRKSFLTTHFTSIDPTTTRRERLKVMLAHESSLVPHDKVPARLEPRAVVIVSLTTSDHTVAVSTDSGLARVVAATKGFELAAVGPSV